MELQRVWVLRGPNFWARCTVLEAELALSQPPPCSLSMFAGMQNRLAEVLAPLADSASSTLSFDPETPLPDVVKSLALELQRQAGSAVSFGVTTPTKQTGLWRVVIEYEEEDLGRACLDAALDVCRAAFLVGQTFLSASSRQTGMSAPQQEQAGLSHVGSLLERLRNLAHEVRLGPSTGAIVRAAKQRGIPTRRLNDGSLVQLGHGARQRRVLTAETDQTSAIAQSIAQDKQLTRALLQAVGVPVPEGRPVADAEDAWRAAEEIGGPVVVKPQYGNQGRGVATNLRTREQVLRAYAAAREESSYILVERYVPGADYRLLVVGNTVAAAALREPAQVIGDGRSTIAKLVEEVNRDPRRSDGHATVLSHIKLDAIGLAVLAEQGYGPESVPPAGRRVLIRRNANLSTGGTASDVTDRVHPEVAARAIEAAQVVGLDIAGVDIVADDVSRPLEEQGGAVVEVNAGPGLRMHLEPSAGTSRPVGDAIVSLLLPEGQTGRIPIVAVTGVNGKTTTTRLIAHILRGTDRVVGMTCTDGTFIGDRCTEARDCSGPRSARNVLLNPRVEAAVLETARGGILREGLGFDMCDVAVVTNIGRGDHFGLRGIETLEDLARVKRTVVEAVAPHGTAVLNAHDPLAVTMSSHCPGSVLYFARDTRHPVIVRHRAEGGRTAVVQHGTFVLAEGSREVISLPLEAIPVTRGGKVAFQVENVLAAAAAAWALGVPMPVLRRGLDSFTGDSRQAPGRFNIFSVDRATVIVDYAHNPSAVEALVAAVEQFPASRRTAVFSGCNRRDCDVVAMGELLGKGFDRVMLYRDWGHSGRADGELNALLQQGLANGRRVSEVLHSESEAGAIEQALKSLQPGELLVLGIDSIETALACLGDRAALRGS